MVRASFGRLHWKAVDKKIENDVGTGGLQCYSVNRASYLEITATAPLFVLRNVP